MYVRLPPCILSKPMGLIIRSSEIHAAGCYTTAAIASGARVVEYSGDRLPKDVAERIYRERPFTYLFGVGDGETVIDGYGTAMYINHSCAPNCETEEDEQGRVWIYALRDIAPGEELTYDYYLYDGDGEQPCCCGAPRCRGTMYSPQEIRKRKRAQRRPRRKKSPADASRGLQCAPLPPRPAAPQADMRDR